MELYNSTVYDYTVLVNGAKYELKGLSSIFFNCTENTKVQLKSKEKNSVNIDWLDIILLKMIFGTSTLTNIYPDYSFVIENPDIEKLTLKYNDWNPDGNVFLKSCCTSIAMKNEEYKIENIEELRKKHRVRHILITSAIPLDIVLLIIGYFTDSPYLFIFLFLLFLILFTIPSFKEIHRFKKLLNADYFNKKLIETGIQRRADGFAVKNNPLTNKIVKKLFKFERE